MSAEFVKYFENNGNPTNVEWRKDRLEFTFANGKTFKIRAAADNATSASLYINKG